MPQPTLRATVPTIAMGPITAPLLPRSVVGEQPLQGLTILAVEDSRYTCEALRLMCARAGARLRRAETIAGAKAHLRTYRPDVVLIDLGLPDGRGEGLIRELVMSPRRPQVVLGTSGQAEGRMLALAAGADGFLEKPLDSLAVFCRSLRRHLPELDIMAPAGWDSPVSPDPLALHEDLASAAAALSDNPPLLQQRFLAGFVGSLARQAHDSQLETAARQMAEETGTPAVLQRLIADRLALGADAFAKGG